MRHLLRHTYTNQDEVIAKGLQARKDMVEKYSYAAFGEELKKEFIRIENLLNDRYKKKSNSIEL